VEATKSAGILETLLVPVASLSSSARLRMVNGIGSEIGVHLEKHIRCFETAIGKL